MNLKQLGLPESGNLRSTKSKDVKQRIKCIQTMLEHHKKSNYINQQMIDKMKIEDEKNTQIR